MAAKKSQRKSVQRTKSRSTVPAVRHLRYEVTNSGTAGTETSHYIDLARDLSAINRRFYRQGMVYAVSKVTVVSRNTIPSPGQSAGFVSIGVAPDSWTVRGAWKYGKQLFDAMQNRALASVPNSIRGRYADFKVAALDGAVPSPTYLDPLDNGGNALTGGEWNYSRFVSPDGTTGADEYTAHLLGGHNGTSGAYSSVGLVQSFGNNRATISGDAPQVNLAGDDDPLANLFDDGTVADEILEDMQIDGDAPPYNALLYPGGINHPKPLVVQHGTLGADGRVVLGGFTAICGLIEVEVASPIAADTYSILVEVAQGSHRGVKAEAI